MVCETHLGCVHGVGGREKRFLLKLLAAYRLNEPKYNIMKFSARFALCSVKLGLRLVVVSLLTKSQFSLARRELFVIHVH